MAMQRGSSSYVAYPARALPRLVIRQGSTQIERRSV
jgi:hypothetical protein